MRRDYRWTVVAVAVLAVIAVVLAFGWMTLNTAQSKTGGWVAAFALLGVGIAAAVSYYVLASRAGSSPGRPFWTTGKGVATLVSCALAGLGAMTLLFPLIDPPAATERTVEEDGAKTRTEIVEARDEIIAALSPPQRAVAEAIPGLWGEAGCGVIYDFRVQDGGLIITRVRKTPGMGDYAMTAALVPGGTGEELHASIARSSDAGETEGQALIFTYARAGGEERLNWRNLTHAGYGGTKLERCL